jgi:hypothetical protein
MTFLLRKKSVFCRLPAFATYGECKAKNGVLFYLNLLQYMSDDEYNRLLDCLSRQRHGADNLYEATIKPK